MRAKVVALAVALVTILGADVVSLVRYRAGYPLGVFSVLERSTAAGRKELRAFRREPILAFEAPGTRRGSRTESAAGRDLWGADQPTEIRMLLSLQGEPGDAVDAYRVRAQATGWRLVETACSFTYRSTSVTLTKEIDGRPATLQAYGHLELPPPDSPQRSLILTLTGKAPDRPADDPMGASLRRRDVHCLRSFDPADPTLAPPARVPASGAEICGLLSSAEATRVAPAAGPARSESGAGGWLGCRYGDAAKGGFLVRNTDHARAYYDDRRAAQDPGNPGYALLRESTDAWPSGAWVDTRIGPVEVYGGATATAPGLDARQLVALCELLARRR